MMDDPATLAAAAAGGFVAQLVAGGALLPFIRRTVRAELAPLRERVAKLEGQVSRPPLRRIVTLEG